MKPKSNKRISYLQQRSKCKEFLLGFEDFDSKSLDPDYGRKKYLVKLQEIADEDSQCLDIFYEDL